MKRLLLAILALCLSAIPTFVRTHAEEAPRVFVDSVPANWTSEYGIFQLNMAETPTGQSGVYGILPDGTLSAFGEQTVYVEAYAGGTGYSDDLVTRADFAGRLGVAVEPVELPGELRLAPQTRTYETTLAGYPATVFESRLSFPSYSYDEQTCYTDGSCEPTGFVIWVAGHTQIARNICVEVRPGAPCVVIEYVVSAEASNAAQIGENPELPQFEAALQTTEAFVSTWRIETYDQPLPTPQYLTTVEGTVVAPSYSWVPGVPIFYPLLELRVSLQQQGRVIADTFTTPPDGRFQFNDVPAGADYTIEFALLHAVTNPPYFQLVYDQDNTPLTLTTRAFELTENSPDPTVFNVELGVTADLTSAPVMLTPAQMRDAGLIYYHVREGWQMGAILLGEPLDLSPLNVRVYSTLPLAPTAGAYWFGPIAHAGWSDPIIELDTKVSSFRRFDNGGIVLHEFGHHILADSFADLMPLAAGDNSHDGFANPSTTDSWIEGFATFFAVWTQSDQMQLQRPALWHNEGAVYNLELNYLAWSSQEEFAVAALLWDVIDPVDVTDCTPLPATYLVSQPVVTATVTTSYCDRVAMKREDLWALLTTDATLFSTVPPSAPAGFNYIYDIAQLYEALSVGYSISYLSDADTADIGVGPLDPIDELFVAHGFFGDISPQNLAYDGGEPLGQTPNKQIVVGNQTYLDRNPRRTPPPLSNATVAYRAIDQDSGAEVNVEFFNIDVQFEAPFAALSFSYQTAASAPGRLRYVGPPAFYPARTTIRPLDATDVAAEPFSFSNETYWARLAEEPADTLWTHTFTVRVDDGPDNEATIPQDSGGGGGTVTGVVYPEDSLFESAASIAGVALGAVLIIGSLVLLHKRMRSARAAPLRPLRDAEAAPALTTQAVAVKQPSGNLHHAAEKTFVCANCGRTHSPNARFCAGCGNSIGIAFCPRCRQDIRSDARFCRHCGMALEPAGHAR